MAATPEFRAAAHFAVHIPRCDVADWLSWPRCTDGLLNGLAMKRVTPAPLTGEEVVLNGRKSAIVRFATTGSPHLSLMKRTILSFLALTLRCGVEPDQRSRRPKWPQRPARIKRCAEGETWEYAAGAWADRWERDGSTWAR